MPFSNQAAIDVLRRAMPGHRLWREVRAERLEKEREQLEEQIKEGLTSPAQLAANLIAERHDLRAEVERLQVNLAGEENEAANAYAERDALKHRLKELCDTADLQDSQDAGTPVIGTVTTAEVRAILEDK